MIPLFLSVVIVTQNKSKNLSHLIKSTTSCISNLVSDYEILVIDNASDDDSISQLKIISQEATTTNLLTFALTKKVDINVATWVGLENAIGDAVVIFDPECDDIEFLPKLLAAFIDGADVVFAKNLIQKKQSIFYRIAYTAFNFLYRILNNIEIDNDTPQYRILNRKVVNYILQYPRPSVSYRCLPITGGFTRVNLTYETPLATQKSKNLRSSLEKGIQLLIFTTKAPMRIVTILSLFGACANLIYSVYVILIAIFKSNVSKGWISLSIQQSGMFFVFSLVLLVLGEYILNMTSQNNEGPPYHIGQEFSSSVMTHHEKLNIEDTNKTI